jgi:hypothetical protein
MLQVSYLFPPWAVDDATVAAGGVAPRWFHTKQCRSAGRSPRLHYDVLHITPVLPAAALTWMKRVGATLSFQVRPGLGLGSGLGRSLAARMRTMPQGAQLAARETLAALVHSGALSVRSPTSRVVSPRGLYAASHPLPAGVVCRQVRGTRLAQRPSDTHRLLALMGFTADPDTGLQPASTPAPLPPHSQLPPSRSQAYDASPPAAPPSPSELARWLPAAEVEIQPEPPTDTTRDAAAPPRVARAGRPVKPPPHSSSTCGIS